MASELKASITIKGPFGLAQDRQPGVAEHDRACGTAIREVRKEPRVARDALDGRIDFPEDPLLPRPRVSGEPSGAKPDHAHARAPHRGQFLQRLSHGPGAVVVRDRLTPPGGIEPLHAVQRRSVQEKAIALRTIDAHAVHAEERALRVFNRPVPAVRELAGENHQRERRSKRERLAREREGKQCRNTQQRDEQARRRGRRVAPCHDGGGRNADGHRQRDRDDFPVTP
jgi:hypothetical protein